MVLLNVCVAFRVLELTTNWVSGLDSGDNSIVSALVKVSLQSLVGLMSLHHLHGVKFFQLLHLFLYILQLKKKNPMNVN